MRKNRDDTGRTDRHTNMTECLSVLLCRVYPISGVMCFWYVCTSCPPCVLSVLWGPALLVAPFLFGGATHDPPNAHIHTSPNPNPKPP